MLGHFFGSRRNYLFAGYTGCLLGIVGAQIIAAGKILAGLEFVSYQTGVVLAGVVYFYTLFGGQVNILKTDMFQLGFIVAGLASLTFLLCAHQPGFSCSLQAHSLFNASFSGFDLLILVLTYSVTFVVGPIFIRGCFVQR